MVRSISTRNVTAVAAVYGVALAFCLGLAASPADNPLDPFAARQGKGRGHAHAAASAPAATSGEIRVEDFGAKGDGATDDTAAIQAAIQAGFDKHARTLAFASGKTYLLSSTDSQNSLVLYGKDLTVEGNGATLLKASPRGGYWGDVLDIIGLMPGKPYPVMGAYQGAGAPASNITVKNLTIRHKVQTKSMNSIGIINATDVTLTNVTCVDSPQSAFAMVSDSQDKPVSRISLQGCKAVNSGYHAYRISLQGKGDTLNVVMDHCSSTGIRNADVMKEVEGYKTHVWYRAAGQGGNVGLKILHCTFDDSGAIIATQGARSLVIEDSDLPGGVVLKGGRADDPGFSMQGNRLGSSKAVQDLRGRRR